jgi:signal transduction histidine kinase
MRVDDLRPLSVFDGLTDDQLGELLAGNAKVPIEPGVDAFREGDRADRWWVLVDGALELIRHVGREDTVVGRMDVPGRWAGGFRAWDENGVYLATGRGLQQGRLLSVPATLLRERMTAWFPMGVHLIQGLYGTARSIESTVRQRESLVTLGTLAAGLAHELNNPAAAAARSVDALDRACSQLLSALVRLAEESISADAFLALERLRREVGPPQSASDALAIADREDELVEWLERHGVERGWDLAATFAGVGVDAAWCDRMAELLPRPALQAGLEWVAGTVSVSALLGQVGDATGRVSELVGAVRSYTQMDRASRQPVDVTEGLDSTLVMLGHKLKDGVTVVRDYEPQLPRVDAFPGELNQVWTNLVDNAVDAMDGRGTLRITARADVEAVLVEVGDTGGGMSPDVAARAFDAFYTTKEVGRGTGLGLDIARRIVVDRHGGSIDIDTRAGETVLRVRLPR